MGNADEVAGNKAKTQKPRVCQAPGRKLPNIIIPEAPSLASFKHSIGEHCTQVALKTMGVSEDRSLPCRSAKLNMIVPER